nr:hypothetical protein MACL_00003707 [Theileria orientalis]
MQKVKSKKKVIVTHPYLRSSSNTGDLKSTVPSNTGLSRERWTESKSDTLAYTKSANSPSPTTYIGQNSTPQDITSLSQESIGATQNNIKTVHHSSKVYRNVDHYGPMGMMSTPSMSMSAMESMNGLENDLMDISTIICDSLNDGSIPTARTTVYEEDQGDYDYEEIELNSFVKENLANFFMAASSKSLANKSEDWGIDRSVNTVYSRSGFFADCASADKVFHGEYLSTWGMHSFAECRMPLIFCIILTDREVRKHQGFSPVASLAINLLDRFMANQSDCLTKIVHLVYNKLKSYKHEKSSRKSSLSTKDSISSIDSQESGKSSDKSIKLNKSNKSIKSNKSNKSNKSSEKKNGKLSSRPSAKSDKKVAKVNSKGSRQTKRKAEDVKTNGVKNDDEPEMVNGVDSDDMDKERMIVNMEVVYNLVALACYFIADRYHGLVNVSPKTLMIQWAYTCRIFKKTRYGAYYISKNRHASLHAATCAMFEIYSSLDYVVTVPSVSQMVQSLILSSGDIPCSQNPSEKNLYQNAAYVLGRIALIDDTFHRFRASVLALSIYSLIRKLAYTCNALLDDTCTWLEVDDDEGEIEECKELLVKTLSQFLNSDVLDAVTQPVNVKGRDDDIFTTTLLGDTINMNLRTIKSVSALLSR